YNHRSSLQAHAYTIQAAEKQLAVDLSGYLPHVSAELSFTKFPNLFSSNVFSDFTSLTKTNKIFTVSCDFLLLDFAGPYAQYKVSKEKIEITRLQKERHKKNIRFNIEQSALNAWALQQKEKTAIALNNASTFTINSVQESKNVGLTNTIEWNTNYATYTQNQA